LFKHGSIKIDRLLVFPKPEWIMSSVNLLE